jgi:hypothetical protein
VTDNEQWEALCVAIMNAIMDASLKTADGVPIVDTKMTIVALADCVGMFLLGLEEIDQRDVLEGVMQDIVKSILAGMREHQASGNRPRQILTDGGGVQ